MARLLTVTQTCRMQNRHPLDYLNSAIRSHRLAQPAPSLLKNSRPAWCSRSRRAMYCGSMRLNFERSVSAA
jgi:hypothetical protein